MSRDETVEIAEQLGLDVIIHSQNRGYGGNQKTCYDAALAAGADIVVMLHPDYQYDATRIPDLIAPIAAGDRDLMLGSRFLGDPLAGGMPRWKYVSNRFLTGLENFAFGLHLSEYHTGLRAYSRHLLETVPYQLNSDDFVFDQELIAQVVAAGMSARIGEIAVPTRYFEEASSVGFRRSVVYGLSTLRVVARYLLHRLRVRRSPKLVRPPPGLNADADQPGRAPARDARHRDQRLRDLDPHPLGRPQRRVRGPAHRLAGLDRGDARDRDARHRRSRSALAGAARPDRAAPYRRVLGYTYIGYLANNVLPARLGELYRSHALGEGEGVSRTTVLGTVVVERVVDTVMVVAIAAVAVLVLSVRGRDEQRRPARAGVRRPAGHRPRARDRRASSAGCRPA